MGRIRDVEYAHAEYMLYKDEYAAKYVNNRHANKQVNSENTKVLALILIILLGSCIVIIHYFCLYIQCPP